MLNWKQFGIQRFSLKFISNNLKFWRRGVAQLVEWRSPKP